MEPIFHELALDALGLLQHRAATTAGVSRVVIALGGTPGSGKSTMAACVTAILNHAHTEALALSQKIIEDLQKDTSSNQSVNQNNNKQNLNSNININHDANACGRPLYSIHSGNSSMSTLSSEEFYSHGPAPITCSSRLDTDDDIDLQIQKNSFSENNPDLILLSTQVVSNSGPNPVFKQKPVGTYIQKRQHNKTDLTAENRITNPKIKINNVKNTLNNNAKTAANHQPENLYPTFAATVPMDGYHLTRSQLDQMQDPAEAHKRRGSPWTFDVHGVLIMAKTLHESCFTPANNSTHSNPSTYTKSRNLYFPAFDHAAKDPVPEAVEVAASAQIVIIEGLYTLLDVAPWDRIGREYADLTWFINAPLHTTQLRLARRHLRAGIVASLEEGFARVDVNDSLNARYIQAHLLLPDNVIDSIEENQEM